MYVWLKLLNFIETCEEKCDENSYCLNGRCYCLPGYKHDPVTKRCYHSKGKRGLKDFELNWNSKVQIFMDRGNANENPHGTFTNNKLKQIRVLGEMHSLSPLKHPCLLRKVYSNRNFIQVFILVLL